MRDAAFSHPHVFLGADHDANSRRTLWVVALTATMMVGEITAGLLFNSMALLADGVHMATHAGALAVAAAAYAFARRHANDRRFSFGTGKVGDLAGFASALVLAVIAIGIAVESVGRLLEPRNVAFLEATLVAVLGLAVNLASAVLLGGHHHDHGHDHVHGHDHGEDQGHGHDHVDDHGHDHDEAHPDDGSDPRPGGHLAASLRAGHDDNNLRAAFVHVLADALTSILAIAALLAGRFLGWGWLDPAMGIVGALVITVWSIDLLRDTARVLLDTTDPRLEARVRAHVETDPGTRISDLHLWRIGPGAYALILSITGSATGDAVRARLAPLPCLAHVTVEVR